MEGQKHDRGGDTQQKKKEATSKSVRPLKPSGSERPSSQTAMKMAKEVKKSQVAKPRTQ